MNAFVGERETEHAELLGAAEAPTPSMLTVVPRAPVAMNLLGPASIGSMIGAVSWEKIPKVVDAIAGFLGYFGSNYKVTGREMSVTKQALLASTAGSLSAPQGPAIFIPNFHVGQASPLLRDLTDLALRAAILKTERDLLAEELPTADSGPVIEIPDGDNGDGGEGGEAAGGEPPDPERLKSVAKAVQRTTAVLLTYEGFRTGWTGQPAAKPEGRDDKKTSESTSAGDPKAEVTMSTETSKLSNALVQEEAERLKITHLLWISTYSAGGESTVRDRMFFLRDRIGFMGGAAVGYALAGTDGRILSANTLTQFGIIGSDIEELSEGNDFRDIDYKPGDPHS